MPVNDYVEGSTVCSRRLGSIEKFDRKKLQNGASFSDNCGNAFSEEEASSRKCENANAKLSLSNPRISTSTTRYPIRHVTVSQSASNSDEKAV